MISSGFNITEKQLVLSVEALKGLQQRVEKACHVSDRNSWDDIKLCMQPQRTPPKKRDTRGNSQVKVG